MIFALDIFNRYFSFYEKDADPNKNTDDEGTLERFISLQGEELDRAKDLIDNLIENTLDVNKAYERFIPFLESAFGFDQKNDTLWLSSQMNFRKAVLRAFPKLHNLRGTILGYSVPFGYLGITINIEDDILGSGFDSEIEWDDVQRRLDSSSSAIRPYILELFGVRAITPELLRAIRSIIVYNGPIDMKLIRILYNGVVIKELSGDYNKDFSDDFFTI